MDILLIVACLYMAYSNITTLAKIPLAQWQAPQYVMVVLTALLVVVGALKGWQFYKKKIAAGSEKDQEAAENIEVETPAPRKTEYIPTQELTEENLSEMEDWEIEAANFHYTLADDTSAKDKDSSN